MWPRNCFNIEPSILSIYLSTFIFQHLSWLSGGSITSYHSLKNVQIEQDPSLGLSFVDLKLLLYYPYLKIWSKSTFWIFIYFSYKQKQTKDACVVYLVNRYTKALQWRRHALRWPPITSSFLLVVIGTRVLNASPQKLVRTKYS